MKGKSKIHPSYTESTVKEGKRLKTKIMKTTCITLAAWLDHGDSRLKETWETLVPANTVHDKIRYLVALHAAMDMKDRYLCSSEKLPRRKFKVYEEDVNYLKRYDNNFLYCTLTYLYRLQSPFKFSGADGEADHVIVNKSALCKLGYRIICACGSGLPCTESYWDDSRTFMECLRLKCSKCMGNNFPLYQVDEDNNSMTEKMVLGSAHLSGSKMASVARFIGGLQGKVFQFRAKSTKWVKKAISKVVEAEAKESITTAFLSWVMSPQQLQFDVGYGRAERTGSNGGANEVLGVGASNLDKMISTVVFFLKRLQNREQGKKFTSKQLESECSKKAFSFLNKVLQQVEAHTEESAKLLVITDKSNRSTKGLLEKHVPDIDWEWSWCIWHERKCVRKYLKQHMFNVGKQNTAIKSAAIKGVFLEQGWDIPAECQGGGTVAVSVWRQHLLSNLMRKKRHFKTRLWTQDDAIQFASIQSEEDRKTWLDGKSYLETKMNPSKQEASEMWWVAWKEVKYRDIEKESELLGETGWIADREDENSSKGKELSRWVPEWQLCNLSRFSEKILQHVYSCSKKAEGENIVEKAKNMFKLWHNFVNHHRKYGACHINCYHDPYTPEDLEKRAQNKAIDRLDEDEAETLSACLKAKHFSYHNFFRYMCAGSTTSWCENFFSTWGKHGRDKSLRNEDWYVLLTVFKNVIETNEREAGKLEEGKLEPLGKWNSTLRTAMACTANEVDDFCLEKYVQRNQGVLFEDDLMKEVEKLYPARQEREVVVENATESESSEEEVHERRRSQRHRTKHDYRILSVQGRQIIGQKRSLTEISV